ncbi:MAG: hypothetical protein RL065_19 [Bacteroidota bacterium]
MKTTINQPEITPLTVHPTANEILYFLDEINLRLHPSVTSTQKLIPTKIRCIDDSIGGFALGELIAIAARPEMGKTQLLSQLALQFSTQKSVLMMSAIDSATELSVRLISTTFGIPFDHIQFNNLSLAEKELLRNTEVEFKNNRLKIGAYRGSSVETLLNFIIEKIDTTGVEIICIDEPVLLPIITSSTNQSSMIFSLYQGLKNIATEKQVCIVFTCPIKAEVETESFSSRPRLVYVNNCDILEQVVDKLFFMYRPEYYDCEVDEDNQPLYNKVVLSMAINRKGSLHSWDIYPDKKFTRFGEKEEMKIKQSI